MDASKIEDLCREFREMLIRRGAKGTFGNYGIDVVVKDGVYLSHERREVTRSLRDSTRAN